MNLALSEFQQAIRDAARSFLAKECSIDVVREIQESPLGYSSELWQRIAALGWPGLLIPEEYGGIGASFTDLVVLLEETGRALLPSPLISTVLCALAIDSAGNGDQKRAFLPKIASGELKMSLALTEPSASVDSAAISTTAISQQDSYSVTGTKLFVRDAGVSDYLLVIVRTADGRDDGVSLLLVEASAPGITITPLKTIGRDRQCEVVFESVPVSRANLLGAPGQAWPLVDKLVQWGAVAECAEMVGAGQQSFDFAVGYAKDRVLFGRPLGSFQVVQHKCADLFTDVEGSRMLTYYAAWKLSEGLPATADVSRAKVWVSEALRRVTREAHQIHGGIAYIIEHPLHLYFQRQKTSEMAYGDVDYHLRRVAHDLLD